MCVCCSSQNMYISDERKCFCKCAKPCFFNKWSNGFCSRFQLELFLCKVKWMQQVHKMILGLYFFTTKSLALLTIHSNETRDGGMDKCILANLERRGRSTCYFLFFHHCRITIQRYTIKNPFVHFCPLCSPLVFQK